MKESVVHVHLMKRPIVNRGNSEETTDSDKFSNRSKGLSIIDSLTLGEPFGDQASFVSLQGTIRIVLEFENPFAPNRTMASR